MRRCYLYNGILDHWFKAYHYGMYYSYGQFSYPKCLISNRNNDTCLWSTYTDCKQYSQYRATKLQCVAKFPYLQKFHDACFSAFMKHSPPNLQLTKQEFSFREYKLVQPWCAAQKLLCLNLTYIHSPKCLKFLLSSQLMLLKTCTNGRPPSFSYQYWYTYNLPCLFSNDWDGHKDALEEIVKNQSLTVEAVPRGLERSLVEQW